MTSAQLHFKNCPRFQGTDVIQATDRRIPRNIWNVTEIFTDFSYEKRPRWWLLFGALITLDQPHIRSAFRRRETKKKTVLLLSKSDFSKDKMLQYQKNSHCFLVAKFVGYEEIISPNALLRSTDIIPWNPLNASLMFSNLPVVFRLVLFSIDAAAITSILLDTSFGGHHSGHGGENGLK